VASRASPAMSSASTSVESVPQDVKIDVVHNEPSSSTNEALATMHVGRMPAVSTNQQPTTPEVNGRPKSCEEPPAAEDLEAANRCRICMGAEQGQLYSVCRCNAGVHEKCLRKWLDARPQEDVNCEICKAPYTVVKRRRCGVDCSVCRTLCGTWLEGNFCTRVSYASLLAISLAGVVIVISLILLLNGNILLRFPEQESAGWLLLGCVVFYWVLRCMEEIWFCLRSTEAKATDFCCCCINEFVVDQTHAQPLFSLKQLKMVSG